MYAEERTELVEQIGTALGGVNAIDYTNLDKFAHRVKGLGELA